jgi:hypothetical protein
MTGVGVGFTSGCRSDVSRPSACPSIAEPRERASVTLVPVEVGTVPKAIEFFLHASAGVLPVQGKWRVRQMEPALVHHQLRTIVMLTAGNGTLPTYTTKSFTPAGTPSGTRKFT